MQRYETIFSLALRGRGMHGAVCVARCKLFASSSWLRAELDIDTATEDIESSLAAFERGG